MLPVEAEYIRWVITGLMGLVMWFAKRTIDQNESDIKKLQLDLIQVKQEYLHRNDFKEFKLELRELFTELKQDIKDLKGHAS